MNYGILPSKNLIKQIIVSYIIMSYVYSCSLKQKLDGFFVSELLFLDVFFFFFLVNFCFSSYLSEMTKQDVIHQIE